MSVSYDLSGSVAVISLDRPDRFNSVSANLSRGLIDALERAAQEARAAVITGRGKAFCAGADLSDLMADYERNGPDLHRLIKDRFNPMARALLAAPFPTIAAVNGVAAGAGLGLALACDLRLAAEDAYFVAAFIGLGLIPDTGSSWLLVHHLGLSRALEFTTTNRRVAAAEALSLGLVHRVTPAETILNEAVTWAGELAQGPTTAYPANRALLFSAVSATFDQALDQERDVQGRLGRTPNHLEGMRAFLEKRPPDFSAG